MIYLLLLVQLASAFLFLPDTQPQQPQDCSAKQFLIVQFTSNWDNGFFTSQISSGVFGGNQKATSPCSSQLTSADKWRAMALSTNFSEATVITTNATQYKGDASNPIDLSSVYDVANSSMKDNFKAIYVNLYNQKEQLDPVVFSTQTIQDCIMFSFPENAQRANLSLLQDFSAVMTFNQSKNLNNTRDFSVNVAGYIGLAPFTNGDPQHSLLYNLKKNSMIEKPSFSVFYDSTSSKGNIMFGGCDAYGGMVDPKKGFTYIQTSTLYSWTVNASDPMFGSQKFWQYRQDPSDDGMRQALIEIGSPFLHIPSKDFQGFEFYFKGILQMYSKSIFQEITYHRGQRGDSKTVYFGVPCSKIREKAPFWEDHPLTMLLSDERQTSSSQENSIRVNLTSSEMLIPGEKLGYSADTCHLAVVEKAEDFDDNLYIYGVNFLNNYYTMFEGKETDELSWRIGFAEKRPDSSFQEGKVKAFFELDYKVVLFHQILLTAIFAPLAIFVAFCYLRYNLRNQRRNEALKQRLCDVLGKLDDERVVGDIIKDAKLSNQMI